MGALDSVLAGVSGGLRSGLDTYSWQKEMEQKQRVLESNSEIQRLRQEILLKLETMRGDKARDVAGITGESRENVEETRTRGRTDAARSAAEARKVQTDADLLIAAWGNTSREGIETQRQAGEDARWDRASGNARVGAATTQQGQRTTADTARRQQDISRELGLDVNAARIFESQQATERERIRRSGGSAGYQLGGVPTTELVNGTGRPTATPGEVKEPPVQPLPRSEGADEDRLTQLNTQMASLTAQVKTTKDPAKKKALLSQLARAVAAYQAAGGR